MLTYSADKFTSMVRKERLTFLPRAVDDGPGPGLEHVKIRRRTRHQDQVEWE